MLKLEVFQIDWPLREPFTVSRETLHSIPSIQIRLTDQNGCVAQAEAIGIYYTGETPSTMRAQIEAVRSDIELGLTRSALQSVLPAGGARNAIDCALWDLEAKQSGHPAWQAAGLRAFVPQLTAFSFGIMSETALRKQAREFAHFPLLKIKTNRLLGLDPVRIVHEVTPNALFIVDPNQSWGADELDRFGPHLTALNVALLEQPVAAAEDEILRGRQLPVPVAADEAFTDRSSIPSLLGKYQVLNIKLDKTGGLTEALACVSEGKKHDFGIMVGCMIGSSLSMAPATIVAQLSDFADLDGPLLQSADCEHAILYENGLIGVPSRELWG